MAKKIFMDEYGHFKVSDRELCIKFIGEVEDGKTFKVLYRDDDVLVTSFEADLDDVKFLDEYVEKDFKDEVANYDADGTGLGCIYTVDEWRLERDKNYWGEDVWHVEWVREYWNKNIKNF